MTTQFTHRFLRNPAFFRMSLALALLGATFWAGCREHDPPSARLRFCESFSEKNEAIGEDSVFSPGAVSIIVESGWPVDADKLNVRIFRSNGNGNDPYGDEAGVAITRFDTVIRLERILSFADTGRYIVRIATPDNKFIVNGRVRIEPLN